MTERARKLSAVSLFSGAGGLDLGIARAGFDVRLAMELDPEAREVFSRACPDTPLAENGDVTACTPEEVCEWASVAPGELDLLFGGPPCQPFSKSGYWYAGDSGRLTDPRADTLGASLDIADLALPRALLIENVPGLLFEKKNEAYRLIEMRLARTNRRHGTNYKPFVWLLNAADYGVPQTRQRAFVLALRSGFAPEAPSPTHGEGAETPHVNAWSAINDVIPESNEDLVVRGKWADLLPSIPEGENYLWHTSRGGGEPIFGWRTRYWSFLLKLAKNRPSWTIQAAPGPATGPFHWDNRLLSSRELCRLQSFPDSFAPSNTRRLAHRQIGNAVPPLLAQVVGKAIREGLDETAWSQRWALKAHATGITLPRANTVAPVPAEFVPSDTPCDHPGESRGPGAQRRATTAVLA